MKNTIRLFALATLVVSSSALASGHDVRVRWWIVDPHGDVDGAVLSDHATIRFDHMSAASVTHHVHIGDRIQITPDGQTLYLPREQWTLDLGASALGLGGGPSRGTPPLSRSDRAADGMTIAGSTGLRHLTARGVVDAITYGRGHVADGFVLDGGITVRVSTNRASVLEALRPGAHVSVEGEGVRGRYGVGLRATRVVDSSGRVLIDER